MRKEEAYPWKASASSGHITNLKQSILETFDIYEHEPGPDVLNFLRPQFMNFRNKPVSVVGKLFQLSLSNILALNKKSSSTTIKGFITLTPIKLFRL
jgi:hypothetical protein